MGQYVLLNGIVLTARDKVHKYLFSKRPDAGAMPFSLEGGVIYHCGPIIRQSPEGARVIAAGPTTSARMQMYEPFIIEHYNVRGIMGKGGMSGAVANAMKESGCVYFHAIGGAGALLAQRIKKVSGVWLLEEFGPAEAMWAFEVEDFPAVVTIDSQGNSMHRQIEDLSRQRLEEILISG